MTGELIEKEMQVRNGHKQPEERKEYKRAKHESENIKNKTRNTIEFGMSKLSLIMWGKTESDIITGKKKK